MRSDFNEKQEQKRERYAALSKHLKNRSDGLFSTASKLASAIPMGQPILVGHHSEKRHRKHIAQIDSTMSRAFETADKAQHYAEKLERLDDNSVIKTDDPQAEEKLTAKLERLVKAQEAMKAANKIIKSKISEPEKVDKMINELNFSEALALQTMEPDFMGRIGFPSYILTNNNAKIKQVKERLAHLEKLDKIGEQARDYGDIRLEVSGADNRVKLFFPGKPSEDIRKMLKSAGFRWAPSVGAWIRNVSNYAIHQAKEIAAKASAE